MDSIKYNWCPFKKRKFGSRDRYAQRADDVETERGQASLSPGEGPSTRPSLTALRGSNLMMLGPWTLGSRTVKLHIFAV